MTQRALRQRDHLDPRRRVHRACEIGYPVRMLARLLDGWCLLNPPWLVPCPGGGRWYDIGPCTRCGPCASRAAKRRTATASREEGCLSWVTAAALTPNSRYAGAVTVAVCFILIGGLPQESRHERDHLNPHRRVHRADGAGTSVRMLALLMDGGASTSAVAGPQRWWRSAVGGRRSGLARAIRQNGYREGGREGGAFVVPMLL